jgi:hypothetical protein
MRLARAAVALAVLLAGAAACTDDDGGDAGPPATGTDTEFCTALRTAITEDTTIFDPLQPTTAADTEHATAQLAEAAPAEIADAMRLLADSFAQVAEVLAAHDPSDPEATQAIEDLELDEAAITDAQGEVSAYARDTCGIDIEAINAASVTTTTGVPTSTTLPGTTLPPVVETTTPPTTG